METMRRRDLLLGGAAWMGAGLLARPAPAATPGISVSPAGDDANPGTDERPLRTLAAACRRAAGFPHGAGGVIRLAAGVYPESEPCLVPPGVSVHGAGMGRTVVRWSATADMEAAPALNGPHLFALQVYDTDGASFKDFTLDGRLYTPTGADEKPKGPRAHGGLLIHNARKVGVGNVEFLGFNNAGLWMTDAEDCHVHHCRFSDCGHPHAEGCTGALRVGDLTDCTIHDNVIREWRGAYGIKSARFSREPGWPKPAPGGEFRAQMRRVLVFRNDIKVRQQGGWGQGQPNMCLEYWNVRPVACEIFENRFNECVSLTGEGDDPKTIRVHHNRFVLEPGYSYAIEASTHNLEIDHNYFANGFYPIACFGPRRDGLNIHHNIFDGIEKIDLLHFRSGVRNLRFVNNTVYVRASFPVLLLGSGASEGVEVARNLFYKEGEPHAHEFLFLGKGEKDPGGPATLREGTLRVSDNAFFRWKPEGASPLTGAPLLAEAGARETGAFFRLRPDSPLRARGIGATAPGSAW
jgi:hypothetical protein